MFSYIRYFAAISFIMVVVAAGIVGYSFKQIASGDMLALVNSNSTALAQGFINTTWKNHRKSKLFDLYRQFTSSGLAREEWKNYQGYAEMVNGFQSLSRDVFKYFEEMPIVRINIYTSDGMRIISVDQSKIESANNPGSGGFSSKVDPVASSASFKQAMMGKTVQEVEENTEFRQPDGSKTTGTLVRTLVPMVAEEYVPIVLDPKQLNLSASPKKPVEGVIEVYFDVTEPWKKLDLFRLIGAGGIVFIFVIVIVILLFTSAKAESIIAKQHETNMELATQASAAQAENRDKSQFLANISHELRTPLNAIIGFSEFIKSERSGPLGNDKYGEYIRDIHASGVHLLSLINDILDYSKAEADKLELDVAEVDITKAIKNSMRLISPRAEQAGVTLVEEIPKEHFVLSTDQKKFKQVMLNLLSNAVKFTPAGGAVTVTAWQNAVDESVTVEVKDTGIGIAPKDISRAMTPFGQVDSALSRKYEGTGLGLPLTKKFVELMGGTFAISSELEKGTTITFTLPRNTVKKT